MMVDTNECTKGLDIPTSLEEHSNMIGNTLKVIMFYLAVTKPLYCAGLEYQQL